jgi:prepilin signal peptidase PulO-like enzyme (type II secretory pathway)
MNLEILYYIFVFVFGVCIGSFLNCFIYRLENKKTLKGRSFCPNCKHILNWKDLFPVFSFLFLGGKCKYCKKKISWQYPAVEIATGIIFLMIFYWITVFAGMTGVIFWFYIASVLIIIFVYDLKHYEIPDKVLFPAIIISALYCVLFNFNNILNYILAVLVGAGFFFLIWFFSKGKWMGFGDVKFAILMGLLLGFSKTLLALFLAFLLGAVMGLILMALQKKKIKSEIPFGPFLIVGTFLAIFFGEKIVNWYLNFLI